MNIEEYQSLLDKIQTLKNKLARKEGELKQLQKQREKELGVKTDEEADKLLKQLQRDLKRLEPDYEEAKQKFLDKWENRIND